MDWASVAMMKTRRRIWFWMVAHGVVVTLFGVTVFAGFPVRSVAATVIWTLLAAGATWLPISVLRRFFRQADDSPEALDLAWRIAFLAYTPLWGGLFLVQLCVLHAH